MISIELPNSIPSILHQFTQALQKWKTWDLVTKVQNYQLIKDYLHELYRELGNSPVSPL
jgi:hypothetical protein